MTSLPVMGVCAVAGSVVSLLIYRQWKAAQRDNGSLSGFVSTPSGKILSVATGAIIGAVASTQTGWKSLADISRSGLLLWSPVALEIAILAAKNQLVSLTYYSTHEIAGSPGADPASPGFNAVDRRIGVARLYDRFKYTLYVIEVILTGYVLGAAPEKMHWLYLAKMLVMFPLRVIEFRRSKMQLYNYELCLFVNYAMCIYLWAPESFWEMTGRTIGLTRTRMFEGLFGLANGPVANYLLFFDGALSFFDRGKTTSALIHHAPALLSYCIVHKMQGDRANFPIPATTEGIFTRSILFYGVWAAFQFFVVLAQYGSAIEKGDLLCVFNEPSMDPIRHFSKHRKLNRIVYFLIHGSMTAAVIALTPFLYKSERSHFTFLFLLTICVIWNGSQDTFARLGQSYNDELRNRLHIVDEEEAEDDSVPPEVQNRVIKFLLEVVGSDSKKTREDFLKGGDLVEHGLDSMRIGTFGSKLMESEKIYELEVPELMHKTAREIAKLAVERGGKGAQKIIVAPDSFLLEPTRPAPKLGDGDTLAEKFLNTCDRMKGYSALADDTKPGGNILTYDRLKVGAILVATYLSQSPKCKGSDRVGVMLPASVGANIFTVGSMVAGKVPTMINFTMSADFVEYTTEMAQLPAIITSRLFTQTLAAKGIKFTQKISDKFIFAEDVMAEFTTFDKIWAALFTAKHSTKSLLASFNNKRTYEDTAIIIFTSGSTSKPKGVPLSNRNIIENLKGVFDRAQFTTNDIVMGALPAFHSFGMAATTICPIIFGVRCVYYPNPTAFFDIGRQMARWRPTVYLSTPSWMMKVYQASEKHPEWTSTLRTVIVGAEKCPSTLKELVRSKKADVIEGYGISECSPAISTTMLNATPANAGVGFALDNLDMRLVTFGDEPALNKKHVEAKEALAKLNKGSSATEKEKELAQKQFDLLDSQVTLRAEIRKELAALKKKELSTSASAAASGSSSNANYDIVDKISLLECRLARQCVMTEVQPEEIDPQTGKEKLGCIVVSGPSIFGNPTGEAYLTHKVWEIVGDEYKFDPYLEFDGKVFYNSEDMGVLTEKTGLRNGRACLIIKDRLKRFVKKFGEMLSMGAIEKVVAPEFMLKDKNGFAVEFTSVKNEKDGFDEPKVGALVARESVKGDEDEAARRIRAALSKSFEGPALNLYMPDAVILVDEVPQLGTGKCDLAACKKLVKEYYAVKSLQQKAK